jgi:hypothetical protein
MLPKPSSHYWNDALFPEGSQADELIPIDHDGRRGWRAADVGTRIYVTATLKSGQSQTATSRNHDHNQPTTQRINFPQILHIKYHTHEKNENT